MFKSGKWKSQSKTKAVFQMQFQATQVPQLKGKKGLMISLVPADVGKPTVRLEKAAIVEGTCTWKSPIYETVKMIKHQKTGRYKEKIYYFNVATGSSKAGFVGEVGVDFADFAEATEPFQISLPLTTSDSGAILHVFIQKLMQGTDDQREINENESSQTESIGLKKQSVDCSEDGDILDFTEDDYFKGANFHNIRDPQVDNPNFQQQRTIRRDSENHVNQRSSTDWSLGSASDRSMADILNSPEDNNHTKRSAEASNNTVETLRSEIRRLERQAEMSELELQSLRKQNAKETKRAQDLSRQIVEIREENCTLITECEHLKSMQKSIDMAVHNQSDLKSEELRVLLEEIRQELKHEKDLNKTLWLQLQKTEESNSELVLEVEDLDKTVEQKNREISNLSAKVKESQIVKNRRDREEEEKKTEESTTKQMIEDLYAEIELCRKDKEESQIRMEQLSQDYEFLLKENYDLSSKLEQTKIEQMKMQSEYSKSSATIKEYELQVERLEEKIKKQAIEFSQSLDTIEELETHLKSMEKELEKQEHNFKDDLEALMKTKVEQEQRAIQAEEALRKTRSNSSTAVEDLQEELKRLSVEMTSKLDENEKLTSQSVAEAQNLHQQIRDLQEALKKSHEELSLTKDLYEQKLQKLSDQKNQQAEKDLEKEFASLRKKAEKLQVESSTWKLLMDEKKVTIGSLESELKMLRANYNDVKESVFVMELEKERLRKEVSRLEHILRKKEDVTTKSDPPKHLNLLKEYTLEESSNEGSCSEKELTVSNCRVSDEHNRKQLLSELSSLDERNKSMERELKEMQEKYSEISLRFAEVEGERQQLVMTLRNLRNGKRT